MHSIGVALALNLRPVKLLVWPCRSEAFRALSLQTGEVSKPPRVLTSIRGLINRMTRACLAIVIKLS